MQIANSHLKCQFLIWLALLASGTLAAQEPLAFASGSWFNPERDGEGFVVQLLPEKRATVTWFTYPPEGEIGEQAWLIGSGDTVGNRIVITEMVRPVGATFGPDFDPDEVVRENWGSLELTFEDCNTATAIWNGPPAFGSGSMDLVRLSSIDDVECNPGTTSEPDRVISGRSGAWYDPSHDGEGWMVETLADGRMVVYWFTYDDQGRQVWLLGIARIEGKTAWTEDMVITRGAHFGDAFRSEDVVMERWGSFGFLFEDCVNAKMRYASTDARFGEGTLEPEHLALLAETDCTEPPPVEPLTSGEWRQSTPVDAAATESASTGSGGFVYTVGGIRTFSQFQRFEPASGTHREMPQLPAPRHHLMMTSDGHDLYVAGGYDSKSGNENPQDNFWRFDPDVGVWEILPDLPQVRAAGDAVYLNGRVWVLGGVGSGNEMLAYDIRTGAWELLSGDPRMIVDHMQAVTFENEIWWMGGRSHTAFNTVLIWNPVTREWREGPSMNDPRSGFAASVVQGQIIVSGGEVVDGMSYSLTLSLEVFAPGAESWVLGPRPPVAVHGTTGATVNGEYVLIAGSTVAGRISPNRSTQVFTPVIPASPAGALIPSGETEHTD